MHYLVIVPLFFVIAFVFSMLGMGGGQVYIPILFLAGLIGRGGGSFVVPLLYMAGVEAKAAAATSALAVTFSGLSSFTSHLAGAAQPDWPLWGGCVAAVLAGSQIGSRVMAGHLRGRSLKKIFSVVLLAVAATLVVKDVMLAP